MNQALPFQTRLQHFLPCDGQFGLPFAVGAATQHRPTSTTHSQNSQDCCRIAIQPLAVSAVVADGCSGTHDELEAASSSNNEVAAKLLSYVLTEGALHLANVHTQPSALFLNDLWATAVSSLESLLNAFRPHTMAERERLIVDVLMATVVGFIVTKDWYLVYHCGDGITAINSKLHILEAHAGEYAANLLVRRTQAAGPETGEAGQNGFRVVADGPTSQLHNIFLASDGFAHLVHADEKPLMDFINTTPLPQHVNNGFNFLLPDFRQAIAWNPGVSQAWDDDASFILLRRMSPEGGRRNG